MRRLRALGFGALGFLALTVCSASAQDAPADPFADDASREMHLQRVCDLIEAEATKHKLPKPFLARLIWKESRFDPRAVSPVGALGIAQFMPGTAILRELADPFDMEQAIPASAAYLAEMRDTYGNLGRAAIGYNAGEGRLRRWMASGGYLPSETENYVLSILGVPADRFFDDAFSASITPLVDDSSFRDGCLQLPVLRTRAFPSVDGEQEPLKPWGVQVAGHRDRAVASRQWDRIRRQYGMLGERKPTITRVRAPAGRIYAVQIGADSRSEANALCGKLRASGGFCIVRKN